MSNKLNEGEIPAELWDVRAVSQHKSENPICAFFGAKDSGTSLGFGTSFESIPTEDVLDLFKDVNNRLGKDWILVGKLCEKGNEVRIK